MYAKRSFASLLAVAVLAAVAFAPGLASAGNNSPAASPSATSSPAPSPTTSATTTAPAESPSPSPSPSPAPAAASKTVRVRLLSDCEHGKCNDVVTLDPDTAKAAEKAGLADSSKAAVDYAAGLPQNQPKPKPKA
jgi:hypothetical protein